MAATWIQAAAQFDFSLRLACPEGYAPETIYLDWARTRGGDVEVTEDVSYAAEGANCIVTDTWISMSDDAGTQKVENLRDYQVNEMDPAELDRWSVWDIEPTVEDWLAWAKNNVDGLIWDFINQNRNHLEHSGDIEPNKRYPSRRSWDRLDKVLKQADALEASPAMFNLAQSFVGFEAAVALNDYAQNYERVVTVEQLLNGERQEALAAFSLNEHCAMIEKIESEEICQAEFSDDHVENLAKYFVSLPSEAAMKLWNVISQGGVQENVVKFHRANNGSVGSHLSQILGA